MLIILEKVYHCEYFSIIDVIIWTPRKEKAHASGNILRQRVNPCFIIYTVTRAQTLLHAP